MKWYIEKRVNDGILRHLVDSQEWKKFDLKHREFALEPRNVRLGLATDGFNPFGNMNNKYSIWLVLLISYNLLPWLVMKEPCFMMSLLVLGSNPLGNELDVFLRPLVDELKKLWEDGARTYDASCGMHFQMCAALLWTIYDYHGFSNVSEWRTEGYILVILAMMNHIRRHWKVKLDALTIEPTCLLTTLGEGVGHSMVKLRNR